jgi:hypothetical protein
MPATLKLIDKRVLLPAETMLALGTVSKMELLRLKTVPPGTKCRDVIFRCGAAIVGFDNMPNYTREDATDALTATVTLIRSPACMTHITTMVTIPRFAFCDLGRWRQSLSGLLC